MRNVFATFWAGPAISAYEAACLSSFVRHGCQILVYSYGEVAGLPAGVELRQASEIVDERFTRMFRIKGVPSLSHFSDLFRYRLFQQTGAIWVDTDMYLLRPFDRELPATLLAREDERALCGAIMRLDAADPALAGLVQRTEAIADRNLQWGETGPRLLTEVFGPEVAANAFPARDFYPVHYDDFWKVFLPEHYDECAAWCADAYTVHLWNNIVTKVGVWKDVLPPKGSFLERMFVDDGAEDLFVGTFPAAAMRAVIENYRMRLSGNFGDVAKLARLALPGIKRRTIRQFDRVRDRLVGGARPA